MYMPPSNFSWFFGLVEDVDDPLKVGRVKVRIYNVHSFDEQRVRKEDLPWAHVILPVTSAGFNEYGASPTGLVINSTVFGFFADGMEKQKPVILGTLPGIPQENPELIDPNQLSEDKHDVSRLARGVNKLAEVKEKLRKGVEDVEPRADSSFRAVYPYNKVFETRGGHIIELDDSPGAERIHIYYGGERGGSYIEYAPGRKVDKINGTSIEINMVDKIVRVQGDYKLDIEGNYQTTVGGDMVVDVKGSININSGFNIDVNSTLSTSITATAFNTTALAATTMKSGGFMSVQTGAYMDIKVGGALSVKVGAAATFGVGGPFSVSSGGVVTFGSSSGFVIGTGGPVQIASPQFNVVASAAIFMNAPIIKIG